MEINKIEIKKCDEYDIENIFIIEVNCFDDPWTMSMLLEEFKIDGSLFFKCLVNNIIAGYIIARVVFDEVDIINIAISEKFRKLGLGGKLIEAVIKATKNAKIYSLEVRETNYSAIKLYEKYDFERIGVRKNYYTNPKEDGLIMIRRN